MQVFISYQPFTTKAPIDQAKMADDVNAVRLQNQLITNANQIWLSYAIRSAGSIIESAGTHGSLQIEAEYLTDLQDIVKQYELAISQDLQVGVGMRLTESINALDYLNKKGVKGTFLYDPEMIEMEPVEKASPGQNPGSNAGFEGHHTGPKRKSNADDTNEVIALSKEIEGAKTLAGNDKKKDPESTFHLKAKKQSQVDKVNNQKQASNTDKIKNHLVQVLQQIQAQSEEMGQLKLQAPDVYQSIMSLMQGVISLGRELFSSKSPILKSEDLIKGLDDIKSGSQISTSKQVDQWKGVDRPDSKSYDYSHLVPDSIKKQGYSIHVNHGGHGNLNYFTSRLFDKKGSNVGYVHAYGTKPGIIEPHSFIEKAHRGKGLGVAMYTALYAKAKENGIHTIKGGEHSEQAAKVHEALSRKHGFNYKKTPNPEFGETSASENGPYKYTLKSELDDLDKNIIEEEDLDKGAAFGNQAGGSANPLGLSRVHYKKAPIGTEDKSKIKIRHADGSISWLSQRAGSTQAVEANAPLIGQNSYPASIHSKEAKVRS